MTFAALKLLFCLALAVYGLWTLRRARLSAAPAPFLRREVVGLTGLKFAGAILLYGLFPDFDYASDAALHYLPETLAVLSGDVPYRDFASSYGPLFPVLLAGPVSVWPSVGAIVLTVLAAETLLLVAYVRWAPTAGDEATWRALFLYAASPVSVYWVAVTGYNGALIGLATVGTLLLAHRSRDVLGGFVAGLGFLATKLLALLSWPALALYTLDRGIALRSVGMALALILSASLFAFGIDPLTPVWREFGKFTSGSPWFLATIFVPGIRETSVWVWGPLAAFATVFLGLMAALLRTTARDDSHRFDRAMALTALVHLAFLLASRKSFTFYALSAWLPVTHALVALGRDRGAALAAWAAVGAITTVEPELWQRIRAGGGPSLEDPATWALIVVDLFLVASYLVLASSIFGAFRREPGA